WGFADFPPRRLGNSVCFSAPTLCYPRHSSQKVTAMTKQKLTLTIDDALIEKMKSQATKEKRSLSMMTEGLYREYLERGIEEAKANLPPKAQAESELLLQNLRALWHRINETSTEELLSAIFGEITVPEVSSEILLE